MEVSPIIKINLSSLQDFLSSKEISRNDKIDFLRKNRTEIKQVITGKEFQGIMKNRPLKKFRPFKNSFTKRGDKILLAMALDMDPSEVDNYLDDFDYTFLDNTHKDIKKLDEDRIKKIKTYIYRHGTKNQVIKTLDYELSTAKDKLQLLYQTLEYNTGGVADYFTRPIHRMDNTTLLNLYNVVDSHLDAMEKDGTISAKDRDKTSQWALTRIYRIQNNSKLIKDYKLYKELTL